MTAGAAAGGTAARAGGLGAGARRTARAVSGAAGGRIAPVTRFWVYSAIAPLFQHVGARPVTGRGEPLVGRVIETLPSGLYRVELEDGHKVLVHPSGKARLWAVRILPGDRVQVEISATDTGRGRLLRRLA